MPTTNSTIQFKHGLQETFSNITKDSNTIYFITDTNRLFVGDSEYTRPVQHGSELPTSKNPANSLFVKETGTARELYYSKDGTAWDMIAYLPATITGGVFGNNTSGTVAYGGTVKVPKVTVDNRGYVTAAEDVTITLPTSDKVTTVTTSGNGNAVTGGSISNDGATLTLTKGESFVPASGGTFSGDVGVNGDLKTGGIAPMNGKTIEIQTVLTDNNNPFDYYARLNFKDNIEGTASAFNTYIEGKYVVDKRTGGRYSHLVLDAYNIILDGQNVSCTSNPSEKDHLTNKSYVDNAIASAISASDAMVFKGTVGRSGTVASISVMDYSTAATGDTYKVITTDTLPAKSSFDSAAHDLTPGDLIVYMGKGKFIYVPSSDEDVTSVKVAGSGDTINVSTTAQTGTVVLGDVATKNVSTSTTLNGNGASNDNVPTELAVKTYVDDTNTKISVTATEPNTSKSSMVISNSSQQSNLTTTPTNGNIILGAAASKDVLLEYGPGENNTHNYIPTAKAVHDLVEEAKTYVSLFDADDNDPHPINVHTYSPGYPGTSGDIILGTAAGVNTASSVTNDATTVPTTAAVKTYVDTLENSLGTAATTDATAYATAAQGTKADNAMPKSGGTFTGAVTLAGAPTTDLNAATKKYVDDAVTAATLTWKTL